MKKLIFIALLFASTAAFADPSATPGHESKEARQERQFQQRKARTEKNIEDHIAHEQERLSCVRAASSPEALSACTPPNPHPCRH